jgi:hypothetical protein
MTRSAGEVQGAFALARQGLNSCQISRMTGIPRPTIVNWRLGRIPKRRHWRNSCLRCFGYQAHPFPVLTNASYAYVLGLYLGDGCLLRARRGVHRLNITLDAIYPVIVSEAIPPRPS